MSNNKIVVDATQKADLGYRFTKTELFSIIKDALAGDPEALKNPAIVNIDLMAIKEALDWLQTSGGLDDKTKELISNESWRMLYHRPFITPEQYLTPEFIGEQAGTLWAPVKKAFLEFMDPTMPYRNLVLNTSIGWGKQQPYSANVMMADGSYKKMGDIQVGDEVMTPSGKPATVLEIKDWGVNDVYEIETMDGRKHRVGLQHLNHVHYRDDEDGNPIWEDVETKFILENQDKYAFEFAAID